jgi:peptidase E
MKEIITQIIQKEGITELLHIPFAGVGIRHRTSSWCMPEEFKPFIEGLGVNYLNASYDEDIEAFNGKYIYINGGHYRGFLLLMANKPKLLEKIQNAEIIIGESSGPMIGGETVLNDSKS